VQEQKQLPLAQVQRQRGVVLRELQAVVQTLTYLQRLAVEAVGVQLLALLVVQVVVVVVLVLPIRQVDCHF